MKRINLTLIGLTLLVLTLGIVATIPAGQINYQGKLTDSDGVPVADGSFSIVFKFFDDSTGGTLLWEETHPNVQTKDGSFALLLGSVVPVPDGWFNGGSMPEVFMQIKIGSDGPMTPRSRISSTPQAMAAYRLKGDIVTLPGKMEIHPPEPGVVGGPGFRVQLDPALSKWKLFPPEPGEPDDSCGGLEGTVSSEIVTLNLTANGGWADPCDSLPGIHMAVDPTKAMMLVQRHVGGSSVEIASNITAGIVMTEPASMTSINLGAAPSQGGLFAMSSRSSSSNDSNSVEVMTSSSEARLSLNHSLGGASDEGSMMEISAGPGSGASIYMFNPQPEPPADPSDAAILFNTTPGSGASLLMFNPQPEPPAFPWLEMGTDVGVGVKDANFGGNIGLLMFNPQPEPPAEPQLEMLSDALGGRFNMRGAEISRADGNSATEMKAETTEASLTVAHGYIPMIGGNDSSQITIHADSTQASLSLFGGQASPVGPNIPDIVLTADGTNGGRVGIGTDTPTEALYVVGNIIATGNITALTDTKVKMNIETVVDALDKVCELRGVTYDFRRDDYPKLRLSDKRQLGFLAEEVQAVVPHVVLGSGDNLKSVDYGRLTPLLVEAIKELRQQNEDLKRRIEQLESR